MQRILFGLWMSMSTCVLVGACGQRSVVFESAPSGAVRYDYDGDGFAGAWVCGPDVKGCDADTRNKQPLANFDCNDHDPAIHPGAPDTPGDGIDSNCDGEDGVVSKTVPSQMLGPTTVPAGVSPQ